MSAIAGPEATQFRVHSPQADGVTVCLFTGDTERHVPMVRDGDDWAVTVPGNLAGETYGFRASGIWAPDQKLWFDPTKLLADPGAVEFDRPFVFDAALAQHGIDTAALMPRAIVPGPIAEVPQAPPVFTVGGLIYEIHVRSFTWLHPDIPPEQRGTIGALAHPAIIAHLQKLRVAAVELMPVVAWVDERHLGPLGLTNAWGYNPVAPMALEPRICPGGMAEFAATVAALRAAGIGVILDLVFNHSGESDELGPLLSFRGIDNQAYAHDAAGALVNDTGCGNTLDFANVAFRTLVLDSLRHFVRFAGVDGFRFDLATIMARGPEFDPDAPIFAEIAADRWLADRVLIAEPWDIGPGGYQLGHFPPHWLEWNDRYRDDVRKFWRGDATIGLLATRMAGSADVFGSCADRPCKSVAFLAAHDGFTLADMLAYNERHNFANGEDGRDGQGENYSWNNGVEGPSDDPAVISRRAAYARAMLGTLFASAGTIMLTAGDEFGRSQNGNNNAYAQDNALTWLDWANRDTELEEHVAVLAAWRAAHFPAKASFPEDGAWQTLDGHAMAPADWDAPAAHGFVWRAPNGARVAIDRNAIEVVVSQPKIALP
ncbi:glycogen debranching protein GlgX [Novosphingobium sp.]|uniref:glycogen debranching protein GlgX n=1 Tax=Novosphingobium sp. TaxID=1874826 RepID=UPI003D13E8F2